MKILVSKLKTDRCGHRYSVADPVHMVRLIGRVALMLGAAVVVSGDGGEASAQSRPLDTSETASGETSSVFAGQFVDDGESYQVINASQVPTAADLQTATTSSLESPFLQQVAYQAGCQSCGSGYDDAAYGGAYGGTYGGGNGGACGGGCGGSCGGGQSSFRGGFGGGNCAQCDPFCYASIDLISVRRLGDFRFSLSRNQSLGDFDYEFAPRFTIGTVPDCVSGYEFSFTGPLRWEVGAFVRDDSGNLQSVLEPAPNIPDGTPDGIPPEITEQDLASFNNAVAHEQFYEAEYWSLEMNNTSVGWDIAKVICGARYVQYDERFRFRSINLDNERGLVRSEVRNTLIGAQAGLDLLYPICRNMYADFRSRGGVYANFADSAVGVFSESRQNANPALALNADDKAQVAFLAEMGSGARYQLGEILSARVGLEFGYIGGVATAPEQLRSIVTPSIGRNIRTKEHFFVFGITFGGELRF